MAAIERHFKEVDAELETRIAQRKPEGASARLRELREQLSGRIVDLIGSKRATVTRELAREWGDRAHELQMVCEKIDAALAAEPATPRGHICMARVADAEGGRAECSQTIPCPTHGTRHSSAAEPATPPAQSDEKPWACGCGYMNAGPICTKCHAPKPTEPAAPDAGAGDLDRVGQNNDTVDHEEWADDVDFDLRVLRDEVKALKNALRYLSGLHDKLRERVAALEVRK
jgi:hypothetical protein